MRSFQLIFGRGNREYIGRQESPLVASESLFSIIALAVPRPRTNDFMAQVLVPTQLGFDYEYFR